MTATNPNDNRLQVRLSPEYQRMVAWLAKEMNRSSSDAVRQCIYETYVRMQQEKSTMWTIHNTQFGQYAINEKEGRAARPGRMFDPPLMGAFYPDTREIVWGDERADWDSIATNAALKQTVMFIADGHRQDSRFPSVAKAHPCKDADSAMFWWNHWSEFNTLTHTNAVCYVAHK